MKWYVARKTFLGRNQSGKSLFQVVFVRAKKGNLQGKDVLVIYDTKTEIRGY